jgi:tetratricopeptide (TPR) repeat protein
VLVTLGALVAVSPAFAGAMSGGKADASADPVEVLKTVRGLRRAGALTDAETTLKRALASGRAGSAAADLRLELSRVLIDQHQGKRALRECDQLHKLSGFKEQLCIAEGQLLSRRGSVALPAAEQALSLQPGDYDASVARGRALVQLGRPAEAEAAFHELVQSNPARAEASLFLAELYLAEGKQTAALAVLADARKADPDDPEVLLQYGLAAPPSADTRAALEHALSIRPHFAAATAQLGVVEAALGDTDAAALHSPTGFSIVHGSFSRFGGTNLICPNSRIAAAHTAARAGAP